MADQPSPTKLPAMSPEATAQAVDVLLKQQVVYQEHIRQLQQLVQHQAEQMEEIQKRQFARIHPTRIAPDQQPSRAGDAPSDAEPPEQTEASELPDEGRPTAFTKWVRKGEDGTSTFLVPVRMAKNEDAKTDDLALPSLKTTCENLGMGSWPAVGDRQQGGAGASALLPPFPNSVNALCSTFAAHARPASLESLLATSRAMLPLPSGLSSTSKGAASAHAASEEAEQNTGRPALMPGDFDASKIGRDPFVVKAIATGLCRLFPDMKSPYDAMIDVQLLASGLPTPWPPSTHSWQILEVESCKNKPSTMKRNVDQCHILVRGPGMDRVKVRVWANGRTQTTGCKDRKMLVESNACVARAVRHVDEMCKAAHSLSTAWQGHGANRGWEDETLSKMESRRVLLGEESEPPEIEASERSLSSTCDAACCEASHARDVKIFSAPLLGSWSFNLKANGLRLRMDKLSGFLSLPKFGDRVQKVQIIQARGNSARFNNLCLYILKSCMSRWKVDDDICSAGSNSVYVNVYESGKCSVLAVPDEAAAEELAATVTSLLSEAILEPGLVDYSMPRKRGSGRGRSDETAVSGEAERKRKADCLK